ncbi:MAG: DOMON-like domain-containing protein [Steroidobacteraceae bacterium]
MQQAGLRCHPVTACKAVDDINVAVRRLSASQLQVNYRVLGDLHALRIPDRTTSARHDELWRHTCAELFVADAQSECYCEFNFAPSTEWAAYEFRRYRQGMRPADCAPPVIECMQTAQELLLRITVKVPETLALAVQWRLGLTMVVEDAAGQCSYWALLHTAERPDFHRRDSFVLHL